MLLCLILPLLVGGFPWQAAHAQEEEKQKEQEQEKKKEKKEKKEKKKEEAADDDSGETKSRSVFIKGGRVFTGTGKELRKLEILVVDGTVRNVAESIDPKNVPEGVRTVSLKTENVVTPGLIDAHTYVGGADELNERAVPVVPEAMALDGFSRNAPYLDEVYRSPVTSAAIYPSDEALVGGQPFLLQAVRGNVSDRIARQSLGLKISLRRAALDPDHWPTSLTSMEQHLRDRLKQKEHPLHTMLVKKNFIAFFSVRTRTQARTAIRLIRDVELNGVLVGGASYFSSEKFEHPPDIPVILFPVRVDHSRKHLKAAARLAEKNIRFAFSTHHPETHLTELRYQAIFAARFGLDQHTALRALTADAAAVLGLEEKYGTLEKGKRGDLVVFSDHPLSPASRVIHKIVGGKIAPGHEQ